MPKIVNHDAYRLEMLNQALNLFAQHGYAETSMRQIAKALDVSTGTLYHYFPNKEELFKQLFLSLSQRDISAIFAAAAHTTSLSERLDLVFDFIQNNQQEIFQFMLLTFDYHRLHPSEAPDDFIQSSIEDYRQAIATLTELPEDLTLVLYSTLEGLIFQRFLTPETVNLTASIALLKEMVLRHVDQSN